MNIVVASDDNFVQHCAVTLISLLEHNEVPINVYLLTEGISNENKNHLSNIITSRRGIFNYVLVDQQLLKDFPMPDLSALSHISIATYYRLLIPILLPQTVKKVIYLDCDIVINKSIKDLWETNISDFAIAAAYQITERTVIDIQRLKYPVKYGYFNAGVLLINVDYWRVHSISNRLMNFIKENQETIIFHDQDALNAVLFDKCLKTHCKWNMLSTNFRKSVLSINDYLNGVIINSYDEYKKDIVQSCKNPAIIHFASRPKPWEAKSTHPYRKEYYKYLKGTPWESYTEPSPIISSIYRKLRIFILTISLKGDTYIKTTN